MTNKKFVATLQHYFVEELKCDQGKFAEKLGRDWQTVRKWVKYGLQSEKGRQKIVDEHPWLFTEDVFQGEVSDQVSSVPSASYFAAMVKTEVARHHILTITSILVWFLFRATSAERERFRDELGDDWKDFLSLTRAMTGETAFKITQQEGGLQKWGQQQ